ncbi:MAG: hypothetical protein HDQ99_14020 [Lachnospiraceae bacterium]|nr:hypothetical protein [Lachnospiraceae bacterium]
MVRDFSQAKKEELSRALDLIDDREWKPFMEWCGGRAGEFGEWADRLGIASYTKQIDDYQNKVLEVSSSTREQMDIVFENTAETDRRYAEIFRGYAETVQEQIKRVQTMIQVMQSANRNGTEIKMTACGTDPQAGVPYEERLENGRRVLESYLKVRGITNPEELQRICDLIMERQPNMLINLYYADYNSMAADKAYDLIMDYYSIHKNDRELEYAEGLLDGYLESKGYTNAVERQFIIAMIREEQAQQLLDLYYINLDSPLNCEAIVEDMEKYYAENRERIGLEVIEERFRNDGNAGQYDVVCGYLAFLLDLHYICKAEYDGYISGMEEGLGISSEKREEICGFMLERKEFIKSLESSRVMSNGVKDDKWTRDQIMCALQIEAEMREIGYDDEFIAGLIGNMKHEGSFGTLEGTNLTGNPYWEHINECIDYKNKYSPYKVMEVDLIQLYVDLIYKKYEGNCEKPGEHKFGMGAIQWTNTRGEYLLGLYLEEAGYDTESAKFKEIIQSCLEGDSYEEVYLTEAQARNAEMKMMIYELKEGDYTDIYPEYEEECGNDVLQNVELATQKILFKFIKPKNRISSGREASALRWYAERYNNSTE